LRALFVAIFPCLFGGLLGWCDLFIGGLGGGGSSSNSGLTQHNNFCLSLSKGAGNGKLESDEISECAKREREGGESAVSAQREKIVF